MFLGGLIWGRREEGGEGGQRKDKRISILTADNGIFFSVLSKSVQTAHDAVTFVNLSGLINQQITFYLSKPAQALSLFKKKMSL